MCKKQLWAVDRAEAHRKCLEQRWGREGDMCKMSACVCRWRDSSGSLYKNSDEELYVQIPGSTAAEASVSTTKKAFTLSNETDMYALVFLALFVCLSLFSSLLMGKWRVFGSYLDNSHIFPQSPLCFRGGSTSGPAIEPVRNPAVHEPFGTTLSSHCSRITGALWDKKAAKVNCFWCWIAFCSVMHLLRLFLG